MTNNNKSVRLQKLPVSKTCAYCHKSIRKGIRAVIYTKGAQPPEYLHQICNDRRKSPSGTTKKTK